VAVGVKDPWRSEIKVRGVILVAKLVLRNGYLDLRSKRGLELRDLIDQSKSIVVLEESLEHNESIACDVSASK